MTACTRRWADRTATIATAIALTAMVAAALAVPAGAQAGDGTILYIQDGAVWLSSPDGTEQRRIPADGIFSSPSVAGDGTIVAVRHGSPRRTDAIVRMTTDGEELSAFTPDLVFDGGISELVVNAEGTLTLYTTSGVTESFDTVVIHRVVPADGGGPHQFEAFDEGLGIEWYDDDTVIATQDSSDAIGHQQVGADELQDWFIPRSPVCLSDPDTDPEFCTVSPDAYDVSAGTTLLALTGCDPFEPRESSSCADVLDLYRLEGSPPSAPEAGPCRLAVEAEGTLTGPALSPDGTQVAAQVADVESFFADPEDLSVVVIDDVDVDGCSHGAIRVLAERAYDAVWTPADLLDGAQPGPGPGPQPGGGSTPPEPDEPLADLEDGVRVDGGGAADPVGQAIATSQVWGEDLASLVVLATADRFPDALAGSALAGERGPILLTPFAEDLDPRVAAEIDRVLPDDGVVVILGGTAAVSESAAAQARAAAGSTTCPAPFPTDCRYAGTGREHTAALVGDTVLTLNDGSGGRALLARGDAFADAITGGAYAAEAGVPILLTPPNTLNPATEQFITDNAIGEVIVLGGTAAVDDATMAAVPTRTRRIAGGERTATAAAIATELWDAEGIGGGGIVLVNVRHEDGWQTALTASVISAITNSPQLGVENPPTGPSQAVLDAAARLGGAVEAYGSTDLVSDQQLQTIRQTAG